MKKGLVTLAVALVFALSTATVGFAAKVKCTVDAVDGDKVTMTCEKADKFAAGDKVKVSPAKKKGAIEGC
ncbi:selenite/tellurite reduction operon protein ExtJ [Desulfopila sp. IMCC35008]|uniref:selenite/tellurite reduction operon protein ExtJ n=1 Tax=Desulfopila sp. IMCC35008 TaxID=2653858 RepID=UPI0013D7C028|nr:hypothetical protein [Desulfopila sp. IMCC35008]